MTLNLSDPEMAALEALAEKKGVTKTAVVKQALRLLQMISVRNERGEKLFFEDDETKAKAEVMLL